MVNGVLWTEVVMFALFVALRLYTRKEILNAVGADDYLCILALVRKKNDFLSDHVKLTPPGRSHSLYNLRYYGHTLRTGETIR